MRFISFVFLRNVKFKCKIKNYISIKKQMYFLRLFNCLMLNLRLKPSFYFKILFFS